MNPNLSLFPGRTSVDQEVWDARKRSCAHRLLNGAGQAMLVAYREEPAINLTAVAHGIAADGSLVVAAADPTLIEVLASRDVDAMDVRVSIEKESPDPTVEIVASAVHFLGTARWLPLEETTEAVAAGALPDRVAAIASAPGGCLAVVSMERVLLHDAAGVTPVSWEEVCRQGCEAEAEAAGGGDLFADSFGELLGLDVLSSFGCDAVNELFGAVMLGIVPGALLARQPVRISCEHVQTAVLCVDIDRTGLTLMRVSRDEAVTAFVPFAAPVVGGGELAREIGRLIELGS